MTAPALRLAQAVRDVAAPAFRVASVMALGRGAAHQLDLPEGDELRRAISVGFDVVAQDRGALRAHVTVHNKVSREEASATLGALRASFTPWDGQGVALRLWHYRGESWEPAGRFAFADQAVRR